MRQGRGHNQRASWEICKFEGHKKAVELNRFGFVKTKLSSCFASPDHRQVCMYRVRSRTRLLPQIKTHGQRRPCFRPGHASFVTTSVRGNFNISLSEKGNFNHVAVLTRCLRHLGNPASFSSTTITEMALCERRDPIVLEENFRQPQYPRFTHLGGLALRGRLRTGRLAH